MMGCLKCGRDVEEGQIFCHACLENMERCPVKPGTPISLPRPREEATARKASRLKLPLTPEERVKRLRRRCRWISGLAVLSLIASIVLGIVFLRHLRNDRKPQRGQNYSAMETTEG